MKEPLIVQSNRSISKNDIQNFEKISILLSKDETKEEDIYNKLINVVDKEIQESNNSLHSVLYSWFIRVKTNYKESITENPIIAYALYRCIQYLNFSDLKSLFPAKKSRIEQDFFDYSTALYKGEENSKDELVSNFAKYFVAPAFTSKNMSDIAEEKYKSDLICLQSIFFFLIWDLNDSKGNKKYENLFIDALNSNWYTAETQCQLLNAISLESGFLKQKPFRPIDFTKLPGIRFQQNESILRLLYNFTRPRTVLKEGIINELNFVREQQKAVMPVFPNTKKTNYSPSESSVQIEKVKENLDELKKLDFGFNTEFTQLIFSNNAEIANPFSRKICAKCFQETDLSWYRLDSTNGRINAKRDDRNNIQQSLKNKYLYPERNKVTHMGENFAVYSLFTKEYKDYEKGHWEELILESFYDARAYLKKNKVNDVSDFLIKILTSHLVKMTAELSLKFNTENELWDLLFDKKGLVKLNRTQISKTNIFNVFTDTEILYLKKFMGLLYCSENETTDFITQNNFAIHLYLIYLSFELNLRDC